mgnify:CR=1 FL=1
MKMWSTVEILSQYGKGIKKVECDYWGVWSARELKNREPEAMTGQARLAIYAAAHRRQWGRWATVRFCQRRGVPRRLLTLAIQLDTISRCV